MMKKIVTIGTLVLGLSQTTFAAEPSEKAGNYGQYLMSVVTLFAIASEHDSEGLWMYGKSTATSMAATYGLKAVVKEKRPRPPFTDNSFPSGHATWSFTAASYLHARYGIWAGVPAYGLASLIGYSRVHSHAHYARDVYAGAAIGIASGFLFTRPFSSQGVDVDAGPYADEHSRGLEITARY